MSVVHAVVVLVCSHQFIGRVESERVPLADRVAMEVAILVRKQKPAAGMRQIQSRAVTRRDKHRAPIRLSGLP